MSEAATSDGREPDLPAPADRTTDGVPAPLAGPPPEIPATASPTAMEGLGARLKELRRQAGLSLRELARQAEVSPSLVSQIENGKSRPSVSTLYTFARPLNVPVDAVFGADGHVLAELLAVEAVGGGGFDSAKVWHPSEHATRISAIRRSHRAQLGMAEGVG